MAVGPLVRRGPAPRGGVLVAAGAAGALLAAVRLARLLLARVGCLAGAADGAFLCIATFVSHIVFYVSVGQSTTKVLRLV